MKQLRAYYDREHEKKINELIPEASALADAEFKETGNKHWGRIFMRKMNQIAVAKGLRVPLETLLKVRKKLGMEEIEQW